MSAVQPHGKPHQVNLFVTDRKSSCTSRGKHKRCVVYLDGSHVEVRADDVTGDEDLPWPDLAQVLKVASHPDHRMHGRGTTLRLQHIEVDEAKTGRPGIQSNRWYRFAVQRH